MNLKTMIDIIKILIIIVSFILVAAAVFITDMIAKKWEAWEDDKR